MIRYLSVGEAAEHLGLSVNTVKGYVRRGLFAEPDAQTGTSAFGWLPKTLDKWHAERPGRGARTDLH